MLTYEQTVNALAIEKWHDFMGGAMIAGFDGANIVTKIYDVDYTKLCDDVDARCEAIKKEYYKTKEMPK